VKNGDRWVVTATGKDGTMTVRRAGGHGRRCSADRLRRPTCRARVRDDRLSLAGPDRRNRPRPRLTRHHPRSSLRRRHAWPRGEFPLRRHRLQPRPGDRPRSRRRPPNGERRARRRARQHRHRDLCPGDPPPSTSRGRKAGRACTPSTRRSRKPPKGIAGVPFSASAGSQSNSWKTSARVTHTGRLPAAFRRAEARGIDIGAALPPTRQSPHNR